MAGTSRAKGLILVGGAEPPGLWPLDSRRAGPLLPVANRPIVCHVLEAMGRAGLREVGCVVASWAEDSVREAFGTGEDWGVEVSYLSDGRPAGVARSLMVAEDYLAGAPFVVQAGQGLLCDDLRTLLGRLDALEYDGVLALYRNGVQGSADGLESRRLLALGGRGRAGPAGLAVAGVQVFGAGFLPRARAHLQLHADDPGLTPLLEDCRRDGMRFEVHQVQGWCRFDGDVRQLLEMNRVLLEELPDTANSVEVTGSRVQGRVRIDPTARIESTVIRGPAVIGRGAQLVDAYIGPHTAIGDHVRIEGAEIENSIILARAAIMHIGGRLEASVVGCDARVFRDFSLPRALRLQVGDGVEVALC